MVVEVMLEGFDTSNEYTMHGLHIHTNGDLGDMCRAAGGHYNPHGASHGAPADSERCANNCIHA